METFLLYVVRFCLATVVCWSSAAAYWQYRTGKRKYIRENLLLCLCNALALIYHFTA